MTDKLVEEIARAIREEARWRDTRVSDILETITLCCHSCNWPPRFRAAIESLTLPQTDLEQRAREIAADTIGVKGQIRDLYLSGEMDDGDHVQVALAALASSSVPEQDSWQPEAAAAKDGGQ